jgi:Fungalysin metallopeptidase (M36)/Fungalysin/Thermolysin Propeptide Motif
VIAAAALAICLIGGGVAGASASSPAPGVSAALKAAKAPRSELKPSRTVTFRGVKVVRYRQEVGGIPVLGGDAAVIQPAGTSARVVTDRTQATLSAPASPRVSNARAISIAKAATGAGALEAAPQAGLAIDPRHDGALVRRVVLASGEPQRDFEVLVDAASGRVLEQRNLLHYATGRAKLYTPNPVAENGGYSGLGMGRSADHHDHNTAKLTALRRSVSLPRLSSHSHCLVGKYVKALLGRHHNAVCRSSRNWKHVKRADNRFEALMAYYHVDHIQKYIRSLGFRGNADVHPQRQTVIADAFADDNSFYSPATKTIKYGSGGVDDAEDGDVITHEYGHAIQDAQDRGFGTTLAANSLGEGFGDFMSALNTAITRHLPKYRVSEYCIFDWDGTSGYGGPGVRPCGRVADGSDGISTLNQANANCGSDPHCYGEVWAHGLIDLMRSLPLDSGGAPPIAVDVLFSQFAYADNENFNGAVNLLIAADDAIYGNGDFFSGPHDTAICNEMVGQRHIASSACGP